MSGHNRIQHNKQSSLSQSSPSPLPSYACDQFGNDLTNLDAQCSAETLELEQMAISHLDDSEPEHSQQDSNRYYGQTVKDVPPLTRRSYSNSQDIYKNISAFNREVGQENYHAIQKASQQNIFHTDLPRYEVISHDGNHQKTKVRHITSNQLRDFLDAKFSGFMETMNSQHLTASNYNIHMFCRYMLDIYPAEYPSILKSCRYGLDVCFYLDLQPVQVEKNVLIIDIQDANIYAVIQRLQRMFFVVIECVERPNQFGIAFVTKNTYKHDQICRLSFQYCDGNIGIVHAKQFKQLKSAQFNLLMISSSVDRWPLAMCYSIAGISANNAVFSNLLFPDIENEKKVPVNVNTDNEFHLQSLNYQQKVAVSAITRGTAYPFAFLLVGETDKQIYDVVMESLIQLLKNGKNCLLVYEIFNSETEKLLEVLQLAFNLHLGIDSTILLQSVTEQQFSEPTIIMTDVYEAVEFCWSDKRPHFEYIFFLNSDTIHEAFIFSMLAGIQSMTIDQFQSIRRCNIAFCGLLPQTTDGILNRLLETQFYNSQCDKENHVSYSNQEHNQNGRQVLQPRTDLYRVELLPGWMSNLWEQYVRDLGGNPNYICRL